MIRKALAKWQGTGKEGNGILTSTSGVLNNTPYSFNSRFQNEEGKSGTNPEELIAAAHAGCFSMALSFQLSGAGFPPTELVTDVAVKTESVVEGFKITSIHLQLEGKVANITQEKFLELANVANQNCPVSQALSAVPITLDAKLA